MCSPARHVRHHDARRVSRCGLRRPRGRAARGGVRAVRAVDHGAQARRLTPDPGTDDLVPAPGWDMTTTVSPDPRGLGAAGDRRGLDRDGGHRRERVRDVPVDDGDADRLGGRRSPRRIRPSSRRASSTTPRRRHASSRTPDSAGDRPLTGHDDAERVQSDGHARVDRDLHDGQPRAAGAGDRRSRRRPTAATPTAAGAVDPDRRPGRVDLPRDQHRQRHALQPRGDRRPGRRGDVPAGVARARGPRWPARRAARRLRARTRTSARSTGVDPFGTPVSDTDPSHYFGAAPGIDIEKATNGSDADHPPGPFMPVGGAVTWTYVVTQRGQRRLTGVTVTDDRGVVVSCPATRSRSARR